MCEDARETDKELVKSNYQLGQLDSEIKHVEENTKMLEEEVKRKKLYLQELKKVRKLITPEIEAGIDALQRVKLI